jgi:hypothetical protein
MHPVALAAWVLVVIAVGWAMPLLGLSLAAFLVLDLILGLLRRRRSGRATPTSPAPAGT